MTRPRLEIRFTTVERTLAPCGAGCGPEAAVRLLLAVEVNDAPDELQTWTVCLACDWRDLGPMS